MFTIDRGLFIFHVNVPRLIENILRFSQADIYIPNFVNSK